MYLIVWLPYKYHSYNLHVQMYMPIFEYFQHFIQLFKEHMQINRITKYFYNELWIYMFLVLFNTPTPDHDES